MGGKAMAQFGAQRITDRRTLDKVTACARDAIGSACAQVKLLSVVEETGDKQSWGDIDFLYLGSVDYDQITAGCNHLPRAKLTHAQTNGKVISLLLECLVSEDAEQGQVWGKFQVDLIRCQSLSHLEFAKKYFAYNDIGNLTGRVACGLGFSLTDQGLVYKAYLDGKRLSKTLLTDNWQTALEFLGYDYKLYQQTELNCNTQRGWLDYVQTSRYFCPGFVHLANRTHKGRLRDAKRPTYTAFTDQLQGHSDKFTSKQLAELRHEKAYEAKARWPQIQLDIDASLADYAKKLKLRQLGLNGTNVAMLTGISGPALGKFMTYLLATEPQTEVLANDSLEATDALILAAWAIHNK